MRYSKSWTQALQEVQEQVGVRKVDFVDGVTPDLQEAKPEFEVKYASSKKGPIKVSKFMSLEDAKKFLAQVKKEGMNGIISKGGKPVKEALDDEDKPVVKKVVKMLKKASQAHAGQADDLEKSMKEDNVDEADKKTKDRVKMFKSLRDKKASQGFQPTGLKNEHHQKDANGEPIPHDDEEGLQEHCGECGAMDHVDEKMDGRKKFSGKQAKKDNEARRAAQRKKLGILGPNEEVEVDEAKGEFEVKYASSKKGPIKVSKFNTLDDAKKFLAQVKGEGMNGIISKGGKPVKEEVEIDEKKSDYEDQIKAYLAKGGKIQKGDKPNKRKIDMVTKGFMKKYGAMKKKEADLDAKDKEELEKMMGEAVIQETWLDDDAKKVQSKWKKMDKKAKKKWMDGVMAKAKKDKMPKDEVMDVLDDYGLVEEVSNLQRLEDWGISLKKEGYMVLPAIDREKYTPMRGMEGPFPTFSGKVLYYDPKAGMYYDRDSDIYLSYDAYLEYDKISPSQQKQMDLGPLGDPKSKEYKAMERIKKKAAKMAKKDQLKNESIGMRFVRKHYRKDKDSI